MGDSGGSENQLSCSACGRASRAKVYPCENCGKGYHVACGKLTSCKKDGNLIKACTACIIAAKPDLQNQSRSGGSSVNNSRSASPAPGNSDRISIILNKLEKLDSIELSVKNVSSTVEELKQQMADVMKRLDAVPELVSRIDEVESGLGDLQTVVEDLRRDHQGLVERFNSTTGPDGAVVPGPSGEQIAALQKSNTAIRSELAATKASMSTDVVIGGISGAEATGVNLKLLAVAILSVIYPELEGRDIVSARLLKRREATSPGNRRMSAASSPSSNGSSSSHRSGSGRASNTRRSPRASRPPSIMVRLSSRAILEEILRKRAEKKTFSTQEIPAASLPEAGVTVPLPPSRITIYEFLPQEIFKFHCTVRDRARRRKSGFVAFTRGSQIFVRRKKEDRAVPINTIAELDHFLE